MWCSASMGWSSPTRIGTDAGSSERTGTSRSMRCSRSLLDWPEPPRGNARLPSTAAAVPRSAARRVRHSNVNAYRAVVEEQDHVDLAPFGDLRVAWHHGEAIGQEHRSEDRGSLLAGWPRAQLRHPGLEMDPEVARSAPGVVDGLEGARPDVRPAEHAVPAEAPQ